MSDLVQRWYSGMKRARISARLQTAAVTTAAVAVFLYLWNWLTSSLLQPLLSPTYPFAHPPSAVQEALADLLIAFLFSLLYETREARGRFAAGAAFGVCAGLLTYVPMNLLAISPEQLAAAGIGVPAAQVFVLRAVPGVIALTASGLLAALLHRRER
jgi:hypothetical protein